MGEPRRIQRRRTKGWRMPKGAVYVGRPTVWGNYAADGSHPAYAVACFRRWLEEEASDAWKAKAKAELRGKNLACWCAVGDWCHGDVLLEFVNQ